MHEMSIWNRENREAGTTFYPREQTAEKSMSAWFPRNGGGFTLTSHFIEPLWYSQAINVIIIIAILHTKLEDKKQLAKVMEQVSNGARIWFRSPGLKSPNTEPLTPRFPVQQPSSSKLSTTSCVSQTHLGPAWALCHLHLCLSFLRDLSISFISL